VAGSSIHRANAYVQMQQDIDGVGTPDSGVNRRVKPWKFCLKQTWKCPLRRHPAGGLHVSGQRDSEPVIVGFEQEVFIVMPIQPGGHISKEAAKRWD
jgi:hypothetical protein